MQGGATDDPYNLLVDSVRGLVADRSSTSSPWPCSARTCTTASGAPARPSGSPSTERARTLAKRFAFVAGRDHLGRLLARADLRPRRRHREVRTAHMTDMPDTTLTSDPSHDVPARVTTPTTPPATTRSASPIADTKAPGRPDRRALADPQVRGPAGQPGQPPQAVRHHRRHRPGRRLRRRHPGRGRLRREVLLLPGLPAPGATRSRRRAASTRPRTTRRTATRSTGSSTTPSRAATTAPASRTSTAWPRSARTSSTSASPRASRSPASTAACSTTARSAACRSPARSTPAARPASSC